MDVFVECCALDRHYDILRGIRESERRAKRRALTQIINAALRTNDGLHYYQVSDIVLQALHMIVLAVRNQLRHTQS